MGPAMWVSTEDTTLHKAMRNIRSNVAVPCQLRVAFANVGRAVTVLVCALITSIHDQPSGSSFPCFQHDTLPCLSWRSKHDIYYEA